MLVGKLVQSFSGKSNANTGHTVSGTNFEQHMQYLARETGITLHVAKPDLATFEPTYAGRGFVTVLLNKCSSIDIGMYSNIAFPKGCIPMAVQNQLPLAPLAGREFHLITANQPNGSFIINEARGIPHDLAPIPFAQLLQCMMHSLASIDAWIVEQGYHR
jgi:hypothetical protein